MRRIAFPIETDRLLIRPLTEADAPELHELYSDADAMRYLTDRPPQTIDDTLAWIRPKIAQQEADGLSLWAIVDKVGGTVIGDCGLQFEDEARTEIGLACRLRRSGWHRGYAQEASAACLRAGFEQLGVDRIVGMTHELNIAARRLMERLGMKYFEQREWDGMPMVVYEMSADR